MFFDDDLNSYNQYIENPGEYYQNLCAQAQNIKKNAPFANAFTLFLGAAGLALIADGCIKGFDAYQTLPALFDKNMHDIVCEASIEGLKIASLIMSGIALAGYTAMCHWSDSPGQLLRRIETEKYHLRQDYPGLPPAAQL